MSDFKGIQISPRKDEHADSYIKRFMKAVRNSGILNEVYERQTYRKPSIKRRMKHQKAMWNARIENQ